MVLVSLMCSFGQKMRKAIGSITLMLSAAPVLATPVPLDLSEWRDKRLMVITAHPDDAEGYVGGTLSRLRELNLNVSVAYLVVTSGNAGGDCYDESGAYRPAEYECEPEEIAFLRRKEMKAAGAFLGVEHVWRCGFGDGMLISVHESMVRERISAYVRHFRPHVVLTHAPWANFATPPTCNGQCPDNTTLPNWGHNWDDLGFHPDHQAVGSHVLNTLYSGGSSASNDKLFPELVEAGGLHAWKVSQTYYFGLTADVITHYVPLEEKTLKTKARACALHRSQYHAPPLEGVRWVSNQVAGAVGLPAGLFAEGFQGFF